MQNQNGVIIRIRKVGGAPSLSEVAAQLGVDTKIIDSDYGIQTYDANKGEYHVHLKDGVPPGVAPADVFSNPRIAMFGPPKR